MNRFIVLLLILLVSVGLYSETYKKFRIFTSGCINDSVKNSNIDHTVSGSFPLAFAFGFEKEIRNGKKDNKGWGVRVVIPPKIKDATSNYENSNTKDDLDMLINCSIYKFHKGLIPITRNSSAYFKFKYGTGLAYFIHLGIGFGFEVIEHFSLEAEYNYHMSTIILDTSSTGYLGINLGYSF